MVLQHLLVKRGVLSKLSVGITSDGLELSNYLHFVIRVPERAIIKENAGEYAKVPKYFNSPAPTVAGIVTRSPKGTLVICRRIEKFVLVGNLRDQHETLLDHNRKLNLWFNADLTIKSPDNPFLPKYEIVLDRVVGEHELFGSLMKSELIYFENQFPIDEPAPLYRLTIDPLLYPAHVFPSNNLLVQVYEREDEYVKAAFLGIAPITQNSTMFRQIMWNGK